MTSRYSIEEQSEIVGDALDRLRDAVEFLSCLDGDLADGARYDAQCALDRAVKVQQDLATAGHSHQDGSAT